MHRDVRAVVDAAAALGLRIEPREFPEGTHTAADAARAIGVSLGQIVKSLVFSVDGEPVVALVGGDNLLDEAKLAGAAGAAAGGGEVRRADADGVRDATGFPVGGVPPFGHRRPLRVFVDEGLLAYDELWAAAGTPSVNFALTPADLFRASAGTVCALARR